MRTPGAALVARSRSSPAGPSSASSAASTRRSERACWTIEAMVWSGSAWPETARLTSYTARRTALRDSRAALRSWTSAVSRSMRRKAYQAPLPTTALTTPRTGRMWSGNGRKASEAVSLRTSTVPTRRTAATTTNQRRRRYIRDSAHGGWPSDSSSAGRAHPFGGHYAPRWSDPVRIGPTVLTDGTIVSGQRTDVSRRCAAIRYWRRHRREANVRAGAHRRAVLRLECPISPDCPAHNELPGSIHGLDRLRKESCVACFGGAGGRGGGKPGGGT